MLKYILYIALIFSISELFVYGSSMDYIQQDSFGGKVYSKIAGINNYAYTTPGLSIISVNQDFTLTGSILDFLQGYKSGSGHIVFDTWEKYILYTESMVSGSQKYSVYIPENITQYDIRSLLQGDQNNISSDIYSSAPVNTLITTTPYINVINSLGLSSSNGGSSSSSSPIGGTINKDITAPSVNLIGGSIVNIFLGSLYSELGAQWTDTVDGSGTIVSATSGSVNTSVLGSYVLTYSHTDVAGNTGSITRTINVINIPDTTPPVITLIGSGVVNVLRGSTFVDPGATWIDNVDGSGTIVSATSGSVNTNVLGSYVLTYSHTDVAGNTGSITRTVNVVTGSIPVITLIGSGVITVPFGSGYIDAGATASDVEDGNLTSSIVVNNTVNTGAIGLYTVTYDVVDSQTNSAVQVTRMVNVVTGFAPVITLIGSGVVIVPFGSGYIDAGATASDVEDGNLTSSIVVNNTVNTGAIGLYTVTYDVMDAQTNQAVRVTRVVNVVDTTPPVITLIGSGVVNIYQNGSYIDSGATWTDTVDGGGTIVSATSGSVNVSLTGTYTLSYTHTDMAGNTGIPVTRVVNVIPIPININIGIAKQTFTGFGASQPTDQNRLFTTYGTGKTQNLIQTVYSGLGMNWVRLWVHSGLAEDVASMKINFYRSYIDNGYLPIMQNAGATSFLLAPGRGETTPTEPMSVYASKLAQFIYEIRNERGIRINVTGIANEPAGFSTGQLNDAAKFLRLELDARGLNDVGIIGAECASPDACARLSTTAMKDDSVTWPGLRGIATHSYNMGANAAVEGLILGTGKEYWITEAGRALPRLVDEEPGDVLEASTVSARFLNDMNHSVTHWFWFIGIGHYDKHPANDSGQVLAKPNDTTGEIKLLTKYHYLKQLRAAFDIGAVFHESNSVQERRMNWGYGQKPAITAAMAHNPDGSWSIGVTNATGIPNSRIATYYPSAVYSVSIQLPSGLTNTQFQSYRSNPNGFSGSTILVSDGSGSIHVDVAPNELVTMRSIQ